MDFSKNPVVYVLQSSLCLSSTLCGMLEKKLAKLVSNIISVPTTIKKMSAAKFCDYGLLFNGLHSWQTTNPDQIHETTTSQKQRRKSMHSHFRTSWNYDTVMIKGEHVIRHFAENQRGSLLLASNQHWVVSFWFTDFQTKFQQWVRTY